MDVSLIYEKLSPEFYLLLQSIHGTERQIVVAETGPVGRAFTEKRGHKLRLLFPMLRYNPDEDLVHTTMSFLLQKFQLARFEAHKPADLVSMDGDADAFSRRIDGYIRQLNELRRHVAEQEAELEFAYQRLKASFADAA